MPLGQALLLVVFSLDAWLHFWYNWSLYLACFVVGACPSLLVAHTSIDLSAGLCLAQGLPGVYCILRGCACSALLCLALHVAAAADATAR